jgi:hypothetical protein
LLELLIDLPLCAKFLKDFCIKKKTTNVAKRAFLVKEVSSLLLEKTLPKWNDQGTPVITCLINSQTLDRMLIDLGTRINLMPTYIYKKLNLEELQPTRIVVQLVDKSVRYPKGRLEDVIIQEHDFTYVVEFIVMET